MKLHELQVSEGATRARKRLGRGIGSGTGKTSGKGQKGQTSRSNGGTRLGFEGGQMPLYRQLPKRGFKNVNHAKFAVVNVQNLNVFNDGDEVTPPHLVDKGLVKKEYSGIKILGNGTLTKKLNVKAHKFSKSAKEAILKAGGTVEEI
jgi:large subunit ribosomal protein L15